MSKIFIGTLFMIGVIAAHAATCALRAQERTRYDSANKQYAFDVIPRLLSIPAVFKGEAENSSDAEANEIENSKCLGIFYIAQNGSYYPQLSFPLAGDRLPEAALVSNSGQFVVTFGYDPYTIVIYRTDGTLIKQLALRDFLTEDDASAFYDGSESIWWGKDHYLDEGNGLLVLKVAPPRMPTETEDAQFYELKVELSSGDLVEPKRSFLVWSGADGELPEIEGTLRVESGPPCVAPEEIADAKEIVYMPSWELVNRATSRFTQVYPPVARAARTTGTVVVEVLVDEKGTVRCARALSGHPLLQAAARVTALKWKFAPLEAFGHPVKMIGTIAFHFGRIRPAQ